MRKWVCARPVLSFYIFTLVLSWPYWLALRAAGVWVSPGSMQTHIPGLIAPMLAAIAMTALIAGRAGLIDLAKRAIRLGARPAKSVFLALLPLLLAIVIYGACAIFGRAWPPLEAFTLYPGIPSGLPLMLVALIVLVGNGYGEEVGWRGFALHHLLPRLGPLRSTLAVAGLWLIWHVPLFWINVTMHALLGPMILGWVFSLVCAAFVLAYLYISCNSSIWVVATWHAAYNMVVATAAANEVVTAIISTLVMAWGSLVAIFWWRKGS